MAPPTSRRSKQSSSPPSSSNLLPGIAIGLFAAVTAGFAATRALRKKKRLESQPDEEHACNSLLVQEREIERIGKCDLDGTIIAGAGESVKPLSDLELVIDAMQNGLCLQKSVEGKEDKEEAEGCNGKMSQKNVCVEGEEKIAETVEKEESNGVVGGISDIAVKFKASLVLDKVSAKALQRVLSMTEEEEEGEEESLTGVVEDEDTGEDGDDDRSSAGQSPSPVLVNGRLLDFFEEMSDLRDEPGLVASGSNSLSDSVSECSMQEVSSARVKPLVLADEAMEASWLATKPDFVGAPDQFGRENFMSEEKNWSEGDKTSPIMKTKDENCPQADKEGFDSKDGLGDSSNELDVEIDVYDGKPVLIEIGDKDFSSGKGNAINIKIPSDTCVALEGELLVKLNKGGQEHARIDGKVLSDARPLGECNENASTEQVQHTANICADGLTLSNEALVASPRINGKILCEESQNDPSLSVASAADNGPLQSAQEAADYDAFEAECKITLPPTNGVLPDIPHADDEVELVVELIRDMPALGSDGEGDLRDTRGGDVNADNLHAVCDMFVVNFEVELNEESTQKMTGLESAISEGLYAEEPAVQCGGHDVAIPDSIRDNNADAKCDLVGWKESVGVSTDNLVEVTVESTPEMPTLEGDPLKEESLHVEEEPAMQADEDDATIAEDIGDANPDPTSDRAGLGSAGDTILNGSVERTRESILLLASLESRPLEKVNGEEPELQPGVVDTTVSNFIKNNSPENNAEIEEEQAGFPLVSWEDSIECNEHSLEASAGEFKLSGTEVAELRVDGRTHANQQEIQEILSADDATNDFKQIAPSTLSLRASSNTTRELDQVFSKGALGLQTRSRFSSKVLRYLPIEIGLICVLIALVSFLLQYLEGSMLIQQ